MDLLDSMSNGRRDMPGLTLILGGARSGKSAYALDLARTHPAGTAVLFVATAEALDEEMRARVAAHQEERPASWITLEAPRDVGAAMLRVSAPVALVIVDCITLLVSNVVVPLGDSPAAAEAEEAVMREVDALIDAWRRSGVPWIVISNEVGLGLVPMSPLGRIYRDALGRANRVLAHAADEVLFMVAGLPLRVKGPV
jgi:adenosylcobinamide kinase / adenosylcobinamide-phosphate guanylyltransferase